MLGHLSKVSRSLYTTFSKRERKGEGKKTYEGENVKDKKRNWFFFYLVWYNRRKIGYK